MRFKSQEFFHSWLNKGLIKKKEEPLTSMHPFHWTNVFWLLKINLSKEGFCSDAIEEPFWVPYRTFQSSGKTISYMNILKKLFFPLYRPFCVMKDTQIPQMLKVLLGVIDVVKEPSFLRVFFENWSLKSSLRNQKNMALHFIRKPLPPHFKLPQSWCHLRRSTIWHHKLFWDNRLPAAHWCTSQDLHSSSSI